MKKLLIGECHEDNIFNLVDPTGFLEIEFEAEVVRALSCLFPEYWCGVFAGTFVLEGERRSADLALIHKKLTHWFVVEVEIAGHSLEDHILPQVRCFRYGKPEPSCVTSLERAFGEIGPNQAANLLNHVPRHVAVVGNLPSSEWTTALNAVDVQYLTVSLYRDRSGRSVHGVEGGLVAKTENLGFAQFSAIDNCLRIHRHCGLSIGALQVVDQFGNPASWTVREAGGKLWISKDKGPALLPHDSFVQLLKTSDGRITLREA